MSLIWNDKIHLHLNWYFKHSLWGTNSICDYNYELCFWGRFVFLWKALYIRCKPRASEGTAAIQGQGAFEMPGFQTPRSQERGGKQELWEKLGNSELRDHFEDPGLEPQEIHVTPRTAVRKISGLRAGVWGQRLDSNFNWNIFWLSNLG